MQDLGTRQLCNIMWAMAWYYDRDLDILDPICRYLRQVSIEH